MQNKVTKLKGHQNNYLDKIREDRSWYKLNKEQSFGIFMYRVCLESLRFFTKLLEQKTSIGERFHHTIKGIMFELFTRNNKRKYINFLNEIGQNYNNSFHENIEMNPIESNKENELQF